MIILKNKNKFPTQKNMLIHDKISQQFLAKIVHKTFESFD